MPWAAIGTTALGCCCTTRMSPALSVVDKLSTPVVQRRLQHEPLAYLTGFQDFHGLTLQTDARALVPRPDTETLVDWALSLGLEQAQVLDLGTGSGAIALALQHARPQWHVSAVDASADALVLASGNAQALSLAVNFVHSNWFAQLQGKF
jgi:release factor glutamine methyltransferase